MDGALFDCGFVNTELLGEVSLFNVSGDGITAGVKDEKPTVELLGNAIRSNSEVGLGMLSAVDEGCPPIVICCSLAPSVLDIIVRG